MSSATLPNKPVYKLTPQKNAKVSRQVVDFLNKVLVRKMFSPCACPLLLAPKKDGKWRLCVDSRTINKIVSRYRFPMHRIEDIID